jgi:hypothetical protein
MHSTHSIHFRYLPMSVRVLFTMVLLTFGTAYLMAMIQVWESHAGKDGDPMLSGKDLMIAYSGNPEGTKLETALRGAMSDMLPDEKKKIVFDWLHAGADQATMAGTIKPIMQEHCVSCHSPEVNPHLPDLSSDEGIMKVAQRDEGMTIATLVQVSHIHLFSITFIFFIVGYIFTHAYVRPVWLKCVLIAAPFAVLITDVASWYLTKVWTGFAWMVIISGVIMGLSFAAMWGISMWQMWLGKLPEEVAKQGGRLPRVRWTEAEPAPLRD